MRPVNLIPPDERKGVRTAARTGSFSYVILGGLGLALLAVIALALTSKQVSDREEEVAKLEGDLQEATARAQSLAAFTQFRSTQESRTQTVSALAKSRFDWERVMNEFALVVPSDVWLIEMTGTVSPAVELEGGTEVSLRQQVAGPALTLIGCAPGQDAVARFVADLEDIDGVTRVGVASSELPDEEDSEATAPTPTTDSTSDGVGDCRTRDFITRFEIVTAFDAVPAPAEAAPTTPTVPSPAPGQLAQAGG